MPDQPRELSAGVRRLLEQHERNGGRTILGPAGSESRSCTAFCSPRS
ncbi:MAG: hypothetical protein Q4E05_04000 [Pseudoclavibacter sp.]|nr:hypothetical protein [Pseudoclavibacter sp.]